MDALVVREAEEPLLTGLLVGCGIIFEEALLACCLEEFVMGLAEIPKLDIFSMVVKLNVGEKICLNRLVFVLPRVGFLSE